jgi:hypothetical protein
VRLRTLAVRWVGTGSRRVHRSLARHHQHLAVGRRSRVVFVLEDLPAHVRVKDHHRDRVVVRWQRQQLAGSLDEVCV